MSRTPAGSCGSDASRRSTQPPPRSRRTAMRSATRAGSATPPRESSSSRARAFRRCSPPRERCRRCRVSRCRARARAQSSAVGGERLAEAGVEVARRVAEVPPRLVVLGPVGDAVGRGDQLLEVGREAHQLAEDRAGRCGQLDEAGRHFALRRLAIGDPGHVLHEVAHRRNLSADHVRVADPSLVEREQDAVRRVVDVDQVQAHVRERQRSELAAPGLVDHVAHLGEVAGPVDSARLDDHDRRALLDALLGRLVGQPFRLVVDGHPVAGRALVALVDDLAVRVAEDVDRRDVDDPPDARLPRGVEHTLGPTYVRVVHRLALALRDPDLVDGRAMDGGVAVLARVADDVARRQIALDERRAERFERLPLVARADERDHLVAALAQLANDVPADESGAAGDEDLHEPDPTLEGVEQGRNGRTGENRYGEGIRNPRARQRAFLIAVLPDEPDLAELRELLRTAGVAVAGEMTQRRPSPDPDRYFGKGKLSELKQAIKAADANLVACDDELSPRQERNLEKEIGLPVIDRTAVIIDIFADHAHSAEGKMQVELAQLEYNMARMRGLWTHLERLVAGRGVGGIGTRGPGESQIETDRRLARDRIHALKRRLDEVRGNRAVQRAERERAHLPNVAIAGYTNAGKSTLLNALTGATVGVRDRLFHTLDPTTRTLRLDGRTYLVTDTVGFIRKLPHQLVDAFGATLEETNRADLILHIVDASAPEDELVQMTRAVEDVLEEIGAGDKPRLLVLNKADVLDEERRRELAYRHPDGQLVSALAGEGLEALGERIAAEFERTLCDVELLVPFSDGGTLSELHEVAGDLQRRDTPEGGRVGDRLPAVVAARFDRYAVDGAVKP